MRLHSNCKIVIAFMYFRVQILSIRPVTYSNDCIVLLLCTKTSLTSCTIFIAFLYFSTSCINNKLTDVFHCRLFFHNSLTSPTPFTIAFSLWLPCFGCHFCCKTRFFMKSECRKIFCTWKVIMRRKSINN